MLPEPTLPEPDGSGPPGSATATAPKSSGRVFLVVIDDSPELRVAIRYACLRARKTGGRVALLYVIDDEDTQPLRCTAVDDLSMALVGTGFAYSTRRRSVQAALVAKILPVVRDVRRIGSAAMDLCMVAAGRLDAYYEHGLHVWDSAAGALIAAEAGARVVLPEPGDPDSTAALVVAAAPGIADQLLAALERFDGLAPILG